LPVLILDLRRTGAIIRVEKSTAIIKFEQNVVTIKIRLGERGINLGFWRGTDVIAKFSQVNTTHSSAIIFAAYINTKKNPRTFQSMLVLYNKKQGTFQTFFPLSTGISISLSLLVDS
jgi:hypothetical protein